MFRSTKKQSPNKNTILGETRMKLLDSNDNSVIQKINKYKEFLFMVNFAHDVYRELDITKYEKSLKVYIGKGNNGNLIRSIMKKRFWFEEVKAKE